MDLVLSDLNFFLFFFNKADTPWVLNSSLWIVLSSVFQPRNRLSLGKALKQPSEMFSSLFKETKYLHTFWFYLDQFEVWVLCGLYIPLLKISICPIEECMALVLPYYSEGKRKVLFLVMSRFLFHVSEHDYLLKIQWKFHCNRK